ncbi:MAG: NAD-dependent epimerase/dehydratase family protein [Nanoarchaeota archaeon]|nr:NAD-dependent epimerase/dehydratase family protein [Nanoarchaeota archaeon]
MKFAITGHKGLIGRRLKRRLEVEGNECVLAIDIRDKENPLDVRDISKKEISNIDILFHLASNCKINKCIDNPEWAFENVEGIFNSLEFCKKNKIPKIVYFSSTRVLCPEKNTYTSSKLYGEELCKAYKRCYGIDYIIIRPSTVYGPGEDITKRLMAIFIENARNNRNLIIYGNKDKTLDFTYVDDFVEGVMYSLQRWNEDYNIAGDDEEKLIDVANEVISQTKSLSKIKFESPETEQPQRVKVDISKIISLGYNPQIKIKEGIFRCLSG